MPFLPFQKTNFYLLKSWYKILFPLFIVFSSTSIAQTRSIGVNLTFHTANYNQCETLLIQIQVSRDKEFTNIIEQSNWFKCLPNGSLNYSANIPLNQGNFYWKGRHKDPCTGEVSAWSTPFKFFLLLDPSKLIPGDINGDSLLSLADIVYLANYLFKDKTPPAPSQAGDLNCDSKTSIADLIYLINFFYKAGPVPCIPGVRP